MMKLMRILYFYVILCRMYLFKFVCYVFNTTFTSFFELAIVLY